MNTSLSWFLQFWSTNMFFFEKSQKFEIFMFNVTFFKISEILRLSLKLLTKNNGLTNYDMTQEVRILWLEGKVTWLFYSYFMYLLCTNLHMVKERSPLFVSFDFSPNWVEKLMKTYLFNKLIFGGGALFMHHPVISLAFAFPSLC